MKTYAKRNQTYAKDPEVRVGVDYFYQHEHIIGKFKLHVLKVYYPDDYPSEKFSQYETVSVRFFMIDR